MKGGPATDVLLALAAETLARDVLPQLSGETRYAAAMVRSAIEIAAREVARDPGGGEMERRADAVLLAAVDAFADQRSTDRRGLERALQLKIRLGAFDEEPLRAALLRRLAEKTRRALSDVNPTLADVPIFSTEDPA